MPSNLLRIPLSWEYNNRSYTAMVGDVDVRRINVMDEPRTDGQQGVYVLKRPGLTPGVVFDPPPSPAGGTGQGFTIFNGIVNAVFSDNLFTSGPANSGASGGVWTTVAPAAWVARTHGGCVVLNDTMLVIAGQLNSTVAADVWSTKDGVNWVLVTGSASFGTRAQFGCVVLNNVIYVIGGRDTLTGTFYDDVWSSPDGATWTRILTGAIWGDRYGMGAMVISNGIWMGGGFGSSGTVDLNDSWYSGDGISWTKIADVNTWTGRGNFSVVNINGNAYLYAGNTATGTFFNDSYHSPDGGITWVLGNAAAFASARAGVGTLVYSNKMWAIGGLDTALTNLADVYNSIDGITWTLVTSTPGFTAGFAPYCATFRTPTSVSTGHYQTMWVMGGGLPGAGDNTVHRANLDTALASVLSLIPSTGGQMYYFNSYLEGVALLIKNQVGAWIYDGGGVYPIINTGYPAETVPGLVVIGGFAYVCDPTGLIYNCELDKPFQWPSLNVLPADFEDDPAVAIAKYKNMLVVFSTYTTQFFYDAGLATGSPLLPYLNANMKVGAVAVQFGMSVASVGDSLMWVSQTLQGQRQVVILNGFSPQPVSTPYIDKLLTNYQIINAFSIAREGHQFYVLNLYGGGSWVFDLLMQKWFQWQSPACSSNGQFYFPAALSDTSIGAAANRQFIQGGVDGTIYEVIGNNDNGVNYPVILQTSKLDGGNNRKKFWGQLEIIGDKNNSNPTIEFSDDDYVTWSPPRSVNLLLPRPVLYRNGSSRRRAIRYTQTDNEPMRLEAIELTWEQGM